MKPGVISPFSDAPAAPPPMARQEEVQAPHMEFAK